MAMMRIILFLFLSLLCLSFEASACAGTTAPFCGSSCCCSAEDDLKLRVAFLGEVNAHCCEDDAACISHLKAIICAVCLPSAPAPAEPFSNASKNNELSLPLRCAAPSVSIHDLTTPSTETPTPEWPPADDDGSASTTTNVVIGVIVFVLTLLGGFITYKIRTANLCNYNQCFNNNQCCNNIVCCL